LKMLQFRSAQRQPLAWCHARAVASCAAEACVGPPQRALPEPSAPPARSRREDMWRRARPQFRHVSAPSSFRPRRAPLAADRSIGCTKPCGQVARHSSTWLWSTLARAPGPWRALGAWRQAAFGKGRPDPELIVDTFLEHPKVAQCELVNDVAYVVRELDDDGKPAKLTDWVLQEWFSAKLELPRNSVPSVRFVDRLAWTNSCQGVPFRLIHILGALYDEIDTDSTGSISLQEFLAFCRRANLLQGQGERDALEVFKSASAPVDASDILFEEDDLFGIGENAGNKMKFYEFQKMIMESGIVSIPDDFQDDTSPTYFIEERVVDIILKNWFSKYDTNGDGMMTFGSYVRLVEDYELPFAVSASSFRQLEMSCGGDGCPIDAEPGIDLGAFRRLLERAKVIEIGESIDQEDETGKVWKTLQVTQQFLPNQRVFVADGREGTSPPKKPGHLRFVCISDTHGRHWDLHPRLPEGDVLLHAGDFSMEGGLEEVQDFARWMRLLPFRHKVVIAGNHDLPFDRSYQGPRIRDGGEAEKVRNAFAKVCDGQVTYLEDEQCLIDGISIYGSPWQPAFAGWAFNLPRGEALLDKWRAIPEGVQVLIVHGPALGRRDTCLPSGRRAGCADLLAEVQGRIKPEFLVCGHVHESAGVSFDGTTHFLNASSVNEEYESFHSPLVFDIPVPKVTM